MALRREFSFFFFLHCRHSSGQLQLRLQQRGLEKWKASGKPQPFYWNHISRAGWQRSDAGWHRESWRSSMRRRSPKEALEAESILMATPRWPSSSHWGVLWLQIPAVPEKTQQEQREADGEHPLHTGRSSTASRGKFKKKKKSRKGWIGAIPAAFNTPLH